MNPATKDPKSFCPRDMHRQQPVREGDSQPQAVVAPRPKNPKRIAAGKLNGPKRKPLSPDAIERLRQAALKTRPWEKASGPKTPAGKARSAKNGHARKRLVRSYRELRQALRSLVDPFAEMRRCAGQVLAVSGQDFMSK